MLRFARILAVCVIAISMFVMLYGAYAFILTRQITKSVAVNSEIPVSFSRVRPYMDGVVIDRMKLGEDITLSTVYFEGYPWQILRKNITHIYIKKAHINAAGLYDGRL